MALQGPREKPLPNTSLAQKQGKLLRDARHNNGLTVSGLAERVGYTRAHISGVERGKSRASLDFITKCDNALMSSGELLTAFFPSESPVGARSIIKEAARHLDYLDVPEIDQQSINFADFPEFINDDREILKILLRIARRVTISGLKLNSPITICTKELRSDEPTLIDEGLNTLIGTLLSNGMRVDHYLRLNKGTSASTDLAHQLLSFLKLSDNYRPYSITSHRDSGPVFDLILIPNNLAIIFLATKEQGRIDTAWIYRDPNKINSLAQNISLFKDQAVPLAALFPTVSGDKNIFERLTRDWLNTLTKAESKDGERFLMMNGLSSLTEPLDVYAARLSREVSQVPGKSKEEIADFLNSAVEKRRERKAQFPGQVARYPYRDIVPLSLLYEYKNSGRRAAVDEIFEPATKAEFKSHLKHIIDMLNTYKNYEMALVDDTFRDQYLETWWEAKGSDKTGAVFLEIIRVGKKSPESANVALHNPAISQAFKSFFNELWVNIKPEYRNKDWVIQQLEIACK